MRTLENSTFKSVSASIGVHVLFIVLGSWAFYNNTVQTLELTGNSGGGRRSISLAGINFIGKKSFTPSKMVRTTPKLNHNVVTTNSFIKTPVSITADSVTNTSEAVRSGEGDAQHGSVGLGDGSGTINGRGAGVGDFDHGYLFVQIKNFFESRLGSTLNIRENQLIKIKVILSQQGEVLDAILIQGKLEMSDLRRVISVAKNIPLKSYWKANVYPQELIIPLILTPS